VSDSPNVALLRRAVDAFNRRDLDAALALHDPGVEFTPYERVVEGLGPYRGHDGVRAWFENSLEAFPDLTAELLDVRGQGNKTFARGRLYGTGAGSGAAFERALWLAHAWHDGRLLWWRAFESEAEALSAAGLSE
jgi:ketosteroid isomerase-like protein